MRIVPTNMTITDYCAALDRGEVVVNKEYQRSDRVWPPAARSYLIETIVLGLPLPKLSLYQVTDVKTRKSIKEIVDGQQRSRTIREFYQDKFRLSRKLETERIAGRKYSELDEEDQGCFLDYTLSIDLFVAATRDVVREVFRRMNSYTIPLNPEEHRHASFQGPFKWFINKLARDYSEALVGMGVFGEKQMVRMADTKLFTEVCHALIEGVQTTNKRMLDSLYKSRDKEFPEEDWLRAVIVGAMDVLISLEDIHRGNLMKPHIVYSLLLALIHLAERVGALDEVSDIEAPLEIDMEEAVAGLLALSEALEDPDSAGEAAAFAEASSSRTNVKAQRESRIDWLCHALSGQLV